MRRIVEDKLKKFIKEKYGKIMKISGMKGRKNMLMIFDNDEIEKVLRNEGKWKIRE